MSKKITKDNLFKPAKSKSEAKADITDRAAQTITQEEARAREAKTSRLRLARQRQLDQQTETEPSG